ncbi:MAG: hypothetical protein QHH80_12580 [Anaerolineae bacterium]|nr:hypothetical protein [Anaerolineae bacterium]
MPTVVRDIPITLTADAILESQVRKGRRAPQSAMAREAAEQAAAMALELARPAAVWDEFAVADVSDETLTLHTADGARKLKIGHRVSLLREARRVFVAVWTIGPELEARATELYQGNDSLLSYMLDTAGVLVLGTVGEAVRRIAEERAAAEHWGVSPALSPGSLAGWPVDGQRELCALLPLDIIGVTLTPYNILRPFKSCSALIGSGPGFPSAHVGALCRYCSLAETCWRRREDAQ